MPTGLLPATALLLLAALLYRRNPAHGRLDAILSSALLIGAAIVISTELLSLVGALGFWSLLTGWMVANGVLAAQMWRGGGLRFDPAHWREAFHRWRRSRWWMGVSVIAALTLLIALVAPPNTWDSMTYHLSRVAQWEQHGSVAHYPTHILRQLHRAPGAEFAILQLQLLAGGDRFANCVQWAAYGVAAIAALLTARELGATQAGERLAATFVLTVPMAILQSHSTQTDLVAGAWIGAFVLYGLRWSLRHRRRDLALAGLALGLAILTKSTAFLFAAPFVIGFVIATIRRHRTRSWRPALLLVVLVAGLNAGHVTRNLHCYGRPLGPDMQGAQSFTIAQPSPHTFVSGVTRSLAQQLSTPFVAWNRAVGDSVRFSERLIGNDPSDPRTTWSTTHFGVESSTQHEDTEGSPLHLIIVLAALAAAIGRRRWRGLRTPLGLCTLGTLAGAALFVLLLRWAPWNVRLHLPLWILAAPCLGVFIGAASRPHLTLALSLLCTVWAAPVLLGARARPLIGATSALRTPRTTQYFRHRPELESDYRSIAERLAKRDHRVVGLRMAEDDWEYPLHVLCGPAVVLRHVAVTNVSRHLAPPGAPLPNAIICTHVPASRALSADPRWERTAGGVTATLFERR